MKISNKTYCDPLENIRSYDIQKLREEKHRQDLIMISHIAIEREMNLKDKFSEDEIMAMDNKSKAANQAKMAEEYLEQHHVLLNEVKRHSTLTEYMRDWYGRDLGITSKESALSMSKHIRGFFHNGNYWYYLSTVDHVYNDIDSDLLYGTGDGSMKDYFNSYFINGKKYVGDDSNDMEAKQAFVQRIKNATNFLSEPRLQEVADQFADDVTVQDAILSNMK